MLNSLHGGIGAGTFAVPLSFYGRRAIVRDSHQLLTPLPQIYPDPLLLLIHPILSTSQKKNQDPMQQNA